MAKILIASIGTGRYGQNKYEKVKYKINNRVYQESFVAKALSNHIFVDKIYLFGTSASMWDEVYREFGGSDEKIIAKIIDNKNKKIIDQEIIKEIEKCIDNELEYSGSKIEIINYGLDEDEMWDNFSKFVEIANCLDDGDEIYIDITNSFRSLAIMSFVMIEFANNLHNRIYNLKGLYYGMLEYMSDERNIEKIVPIIDIKILIELLEWTKAIYNIKNFGNASLLISLISKDQKTQQILQAYDNSINLANMNSIQTNLKVLKEEIESLKSHQHKIVQLLSKDLQEFTDILDDVQSTFQYNG